MCGKLILCYSLIINLTSISKARYSKGAEKEDGRRGKRTKVIPDMKQKKEREGGGGGLLPPNGLIRHDMMISDEDGKKGRRI